MNEYFLSTVVLWLLIAIWQVGHCQHIYSRCKNMIHSSGNFFF